MDSLGQLTGGIAHDFNNLLAVVIGNLELLEERTESSNYLRDAMDAAWRAANLSKRLLVFARRQMLAPEIVSVAPLIYGMSALLERTLGADIDVELHLSEDLPFVHVDVGQLENAILNLAINARDAMPSGGKLLISATRFKVDDEYLAERPDVHEGSYVMIEVGDTGTGMTPTTLERVFEPFFTTKEVGKGTGLGLSMVYGFLKQSGGHARIYSELEHGTSVKLYLPAATELDVGETTQTLALLQPAGEERERILIVDDEPFVRRIVVANLQGMGYETVEADTAQAALDLLCEHAEDIDLLLTDLVMPGGMTGIELAEAVRSAWPRIRILLSSGFSEEQAARGSGFPLLSKPYRKVQLAQAVRLALQGGAAT
jgi:CheY-like chemotaxis protein